MKVYFIGAGPGAADLITLRGAAILRRAPMVLYAGSLIPEEMLVHCREDAEIHSTAGMNLDEQEACYRRAREKGWEVARLHSGDPSIYGATAEQMRRLDALEIPWEVIPGVSSFVSSAASIGSELTKPRVSQSIILTRTEGRASPMPEGESIRELAQHRCTMAVFLSGANLNKLVADLLSSYPPETPVALVYKDEWPQARQYKGTLGVLLDEVDPKDWRLSTMMLVGDVLSDEAAAESQLYSAGYSHLFRNSKTTA